ncbi:MAG: hypothetical protein H8E20_10760 [Verrucomicrobia bacterium]|nr:hypothetical protein [Verrucomicrobiota bacterium]
MRLFRLIVVWILAAIWLPATSHCLLGAAGWLPEFCCEVESSCDESGATHDAHTECDVCTAVESGDYNFSKPADFDVSFDAALAWEQVARLTNPAKATQSVPLSSRAPPGLAKRWAFITRAAIPGRAPSFLA